MATDTVIPIVRQRVSLRRRADFGDNLPIDGDPAAGGDGGWDAVFEVACDRVHRQIGPDPGIAEFHYVGAFPGGIERNAVDDRLSAFHVDDQVRVEVEPLDDELGDGSPAPTILFEGVLTFHPFTLARVGDREVEDFRLQAVALPVLDNQRSEHLVRGRAVYVVNPPPEGESDSSAGVLVLESPLEQGAATFNPGRPNRLAFAGGSGTASVAVNAEDQLTVPLWTHDDDPRGGWWTGASAIATLLGVWLVGTDAASPLNRFVTIDPALIEAINGLNADAPTLPDDGQRYAGLGARLPELDVTGMGVFDAVAAVCEAIGFEMSILPEPGDLGDLDRRHVLRIWRRGSGELNDVVLQPAGAAGPNDVSRIQGGRDGNGNVNEVFAVGPTYVEASVVCRPLWRADEWPDPAPNIDDKLQASPDAADGSVQTYFDRHVAGGDEFDAYGHVGRLWGVDCTGALGPDASGQNDGRYAAESAYRQWDDAAQPGLAAGVRGFDWAGVFDFAGVETERSNLGITDAIRWHRGAHRHALPLRSPAAQALGLSYVLEVSEDGGDFWQRCDDVVEFDVVPEWFGFRLVGIDNLAKHNLATLSGFPGTIDAAVSWWAKIASEDLLFRLTCSVRADHAARYDALRQASSGSLYTRGRRAALDVEEVWQSPDCILNTSDPAAWRRVVGWGVTTADGEYVTTVKEVAERVRDRGDTIRVSAAVATWAMVFDRWSLGDRIWGVRGRNIAFGSDTSGERAPTLVGITYDLSAAGEGGELNQGITLHLSDREMTEGMP